MKNFTSFMKRTLLAVLAILGMTTSAQAEVKSVSDLYGKYKFTAKVEYTDAGKSYKGTFKEAADVTIGADPRKVYDGVINGLLGVEGASLTINGLSGDSLMIYNPNFGNAWGGLVSTSADGKNPYALPMYETRYVYNPADGSISIPDFALGRCANDKTPFETFVKVSNAKLELVELDNFKLNDLSGDWHFKAGEGVYSADRNSYIPCEFDMNLKAKDDKFKTYAVQFEMKGYDPVALDATYNGVELSIAINNTYLLESADSAIVFLSTEGTKKVRTGNIVFKKITDNSLSLFTGMGFGVISLPDGKGKSMPQFYTDGMAKREGGSVVGKSWEGTYTFKAGKFMNPLPEYGMKDEFTMVVLPHPVLDGYYISEMMGEKLPQGILLSESETDPDVLTMPEGLKYVKTIDPGKLYLILTDMNATDAPIEFTRNADGSFGLPSLGVMLYNMETQERTLVAYYQELKGSNGAAEVVTWDGSYIFKSGKFMNPKPEYGMKDEFAMKVVPHPVFGGYYISEMMGEALPQGIILNETEGNSNVLTMPEGIKYVRMIDPGKLYLIMTDMNGTDAPMDLTRKEDGTYTLPSFGIMLYNFETKARELVAYYQDVTGTKGEVTPKPEFSWAKTYKVTADVQVYNSNYTYPESFDMTVTYDADKDVYGVTHFLGNDVVSLNYGAVPLQISADDPMKASINSGIYIGAIELGKTYLTLADLNGQNNPINMVADADGKLTIDNFSVMVKSFETGELTAGASYRNVKAEVSTTAVGKVETAGNGVRVDGQTVYVGSKQPVAVYDLSGKCVFKGVTAQVEGLGKGVYVVKTAAAAAKVVIR